MGKYFKSEIFMQNLIPVLVKFGISFAIASAIGKDVNLASSMSTSSMIAGQIFFFLMIYMLCSIFQINFKVTGNYIVGFITGCISIFLLFGGIMQVESMSSILSLSAFVVFLIYDILKLVQIAKMDVD